MKSAGKEGEEFIEFEVHGQKSSSSEEVDELITATGDKEEAEVVVQEEPRSAWRSVAGMMSMVGSACGFSAMSCGLKILYRHVEISAFEVIYWKSLSMILFEYVFIKWSGGDHMETKKELRLTILLRGVTGFIGLACLFTAIQLTSLSKASCLFWSNPIFTALYSRFFLSEKLSNFDWVAIFVCFFGVFLLQNPFSTGSTSLQADVAKIDPFLDMAGSAVAIIGAMIVAFALMLMRKMAGQMHFMISPFYYAIVCTIGSTPVALAQHKMQL